MHNLTPKNLHINGLFFCKIKKIPFLGVFGHYPQNEIFFQKSDYVSFLRLKQPNFMRSFRQILWAVLEKMSLPTDVLIYWQWWNHRTPFLLKAGVQKIIMFTRAYDEKRLCNSMKDMLSTEREEYLTDKFTALWGSNSMFVTQTAEIFTSKPLVAFWKVITIRILL